MTRTTGIAALLLAGALTLSACSAGPAATAPDPTDNGTENSSESPETPAGSGAVGDDGIAIPGQVVDLNLGDPVAYYSFPKLSMDDVQKVTILSFEYFEKSELPDSAPLDKISTGILDITVSWETVAGSTQSNQGYIIATLANGAQGTPRAFRDDRLRNGKVPLGETQTGVFSIEIDRGVTTLTIVDYQQEPVARVVIDTSS